MAKNRAIGRAGELPWKISEDLKHFRRITTGHAVIMGRKTWDSIGRPLPERRMIVVTRSAGLKLEGAEVVGSLDEALTRARETDAMPIVIGGAEIYRAALPRVTKIWLTEVPREVEGDAFFPELPASEWRETSRRRGEEADYVELERVSGDCPRPRPSGRRRPPRGEPANLRPPRCRCRSTPSPRIRCAAR